MQDGPTTAPTAATRTDLCDEFEGPENPDWGCCVPGKGSEIADKLGAWGLSEITHCCYYPKPSLSPVEGTAAELR